VAELIEIDELCVQFAVTRGAFGNSDGVVRAVDGASFTIAAGEIVALVGESGSGKTTVARCIAGLTTPTSGTIRLDGVELDREHLRQRENRRRIQMVFQDPFGSLNPRRRIGDSLAVPLRVHGVVPRSAERAEKLRLLGEVGLAAENATLRRYPHAFSGGERQRIAIARALAPRPSLLIADEPTSSLDISIRAQILQLLLRVRDDHGVGVLFITHDLAVVRSLADRVLVMYLGEVVEAGQTAALFERPAHPYTRSLLGSTPVPAPGSRRPRPVAGEIPDPADPPSGCRFHPRCPMAQAICAAEPPPVVALGDGRSARCHFAESVVASEFQLGAA
jgi:oligopeptide/dipeptide ABC transporter ATP-binding protein